MAKTMAEKRISAATLWKMDSSRIGLCWSETGATHTRGACAEMLCCFGCRSSHSFSRRSFVHPQGRVRWGWINLCFRSWYTSLFRSTLKMKPVPKTRQVSQPSKGTVLKISHPCSPSPPATVSPCLGADKSYLSYSLHSVSDRRLVSSEKMKCKFY